MPELVPLVPLDLPPVGLEGWVTPRGSVEDSDGQEWTLPLRGAACYKAPLDASLKELVRVAWAAGWCPEVIYIKARSSKSPDCFVRVWVPRNAVSEGGKRPLDDSDLGKRIVIHWSQSYDLWWIDSGASPRAMVLFLSLMWPTGKGENSRGSRLCVPYEHPLGEPIISWVAVANDRGTVEASNIQIRGRDGPFLG